MTHEVCVPNVIRVGDSVVIIKALQSDEVPSAPNGSLIEDVKVNYSSLTRYECSNNV